MLRRITKCATRVTLNRTTAPFVRLCDVHMGAIRPGPRLGALRRVGVSVPHPVFRSAAASRMQAARKRTDRAPPIRYVPNLPRSGGARGTLSRRAQSKQRVANTKHLRRGVAQAAIEPCRRPCESMFPVVRAERTSHRGVSSAPSACNLQRSAAERSFRYHSVCRGSERASAGPCTPSMRAGSPSTVHSELRDEIL